MLGLTSSFEPNREVMDSLGMCTEKSVVTPSGEGEVWLPVQGVTARLEAGAQLGMVRPTEVIVYSDVDPLLHAVPEEDPLPFPPCDPLSDLDGSLTSSTAEV
jgi:hypothetical protein